MVPTALPLQRAWIRPLVAARAGHTIPEMWLGMFPGEAEVQRGKGEGESRAAGRRVKWVRSELLVDCLPPHRATPQNASSFLPETRVLSTAKALQQACYWPALPLLPALSWFLKDRSPLGQWENMLSSCKVWFPVFKSNLGSQLGSLLFPASAAPCHHRSSS